MQPIDKDHPEKAFGTPEEWKQWLEWAKDVPWEDLNEVRSRLENVGIVGVPYHKDGKIHVLVEEIKDD
jgi:hypothetical protein